MRSARLKTRTASLLLAMLLAAVGVFVLIGYVRAVEQSAIEDGQPVRVLVAAEPIAAGTKIDASTDHGLVNELTIPRSALVDGAVEQLDEIDGRYATTDIVVGEQLLGVRFSVERRNVLLNVPPDRQAMAVEVVASRGVAGFVQPSDHVSILARASGDGADATVGYLVQDVLVMAVGQSVAGSPSASKLEPQSDQRLVLTLSVTAVDAEKIAYAAMQGELYFTLLPEGQGAQQAPGRNAANLFS